jgi:hypothetical protein
MDSPSPEPSSLSSSMISSSLDAPDKYSSSESIWLLVVSGVGGEAAEAILLFGWASFTLMPFASAAVLFLVVGGMLSTMIRCAGPSMSDEIQARGCREVSEMCRRVSGCSHVFEGSRELV